MSAVQGGPPFGTIARKWRDLAERRLACFTELYQSGRWTHYYASRQQFAAHMLEVIKAAKIWRKLAGDPPADSADDDRHAAE